MPRRLLLAGLTACVILAAGAAHGATASYEYDALGRLTKVTSSDGKLAVYKYDAAGNRTQVVSGSQAGVPSSITVPTSSTSGAYTISWGAASGTLTAYELFEATNSSFTGQTRIYNGTALSAALTGRANGTYYYRVRACLDTDCSSYRTGANAVTVSIATAPGIPLAPSSITAPSMNSTGNFSVSWSASTGATRYELWQSFFDGAFTKAYDGSSTFKSFSNKSNGEYTYKAKACSAAGCSDFSATAFVMVCVGGCTFAAPPPTE